MQSLIKIICMLLLIGFSTTCFATSTDSATVTTRRLEIKADITYKFINFNNVRSKIEGKITITNRTPTAQKYGNNFLQLIVNGRLTARTYKDTIASDAIDFTVVEIKPRSSLSLPVYWVFEVPLETEIGSVRLYLDEEGVEKAEGITRP